MEEKRTPFADMRAIFGRAATEFVAAVQVAHETGLAETGDEFTVVAVEVFEDAGGEGFHFGKN